MSGIMLRKTAIAIHVHKYNYMQLYKHKDGVTLSQEFGFMI